MASDLTLVDLFDGSARRWPERDAVKDPAGGTATYRELDHLSNRVAAYLRFLGVSRGDRVAVCLPKSVDAVAAILGILRAGAAYVPIDASAPTRRGAYIMTDCQVRVAFVDAGQAEAFQGELEGRGPERRGPLPRLVPLGTPGQGFPLAAAVSDLSDSAGSPDRPGPDDVAYVLYTSGSTGNPKGVTLTHRNARSFVDWCAATFSPVESDTFSSHAPFHFDLSILDLYVPLGHGARVVLIGADQGKEPRGLARLIAEEGITVWYSTPSILSLLTQFGDLTRHDFSALRLVLFAGEVFPIKHLRVLKEQVPHPRYFNLYGPTETNVCTYLEIPAVIPPDRTSPYPIGRACEHMAARVIDESGADTAPGTRGELCISGDGVMRGYWNQADRDAAVFFHDDSGRRWYRTGDLVIDPGTGSFEFCGRRDRMVKKRGYRIELGEIEAGLYRHPDVSEAAVVATTPGDGEVRITAFLQPRSGQTLSVIRMKQFCARELPSYMVPDLFEFRDTLPKTSTDKIDYLRLTHPS